MSEINDEHETEEATILTEESSLRGEGFDELFSDDSAAFEKVALRDVLPEAFTGDALDTASRAEKGVALEHVLRALSCRKSSSALSASDLEFLREFFCKLYGGLNVYRHEYSALSELMYELLKENEERDIDLADNLPSELNTLATNITAVRTYLEKLSEGEDGVELVPESVLGSVGKLDDHIELEFQRIRYQVKQNLSLHRSVIEFNEQVDAAKKSLTQDFVGKIQAAQNRSRLVMKSLEERFEQHVRDTETRSQRNYVSVLGIFISLVISFSAGIRLSTEAIQALSGMGTYRFAAVLSIVVVGMFDLILTLLFFILVVSDLDGGAKKLVKQVGIGVNIAFALVLIAIIVAKYLKLFG